MRVEKIEIAVRAALSNSVATRHGPHWFMEKRFFAKPAWAHLRSPFDVLGWHNNLIGTIKREIGHDPAQSGKRDVFIKHFYDTYDHPELPPCWMVFEAISFGTISQMFRNLAHPEYEDICIGLIRPEHLCPSLAALEPGLHDQTHDRSKVRSRIPIQRSGLCPTACDAAFAEEGLVNKSLCRRIEGACSSSPGYPNRGHGLSR
jgi:hypothetical protein